MDFGKFLYQQKKKAHESKKKQKIIHVKEVKFRPNIDEHDYDFKLKNASASWRGGQGQGHRPVPRPRDGAPGPGPQADPALAGDLGEEGVLESSPEIAGNRMHVIFGPPRHVQSRSPLAGPLLPEPPLREAGIGLRG